MVVEAIERRMVLRCHNEEKYPRAYAAMVQIIGLMAVMEKQIGSRGRGWDVDFGCPEQRG
jgi:hypothetical protein